MPLTRTRAVRVLFGPAKSSAVSSYTIAVCSSGSMNHALLNTSLLSAAVISAFAAASENALIAALCSLYTLMDSDSANSEKCSGCNGQVIDDSLITGLGELDAEIRFPVLRIGHRDERDILYCVFPVLAQSL